MKKHLLLFILALILAFALGVGGCTKQSSTGNNTKKSTVDSRVEELLIVNHTSLTGSLADYGQAAKNGVEIAAKNTGTFKVGDRRYKIKILHLDDKTEAAESIAVAQKAVAKDAVAVIGCLFSDNTLAALPIYSKAKIPVISPSSTQPDLTENDKNVFFRTCLRDDLQGKVLGEWAAKLGYKTVTVIDSSDEYSTSLGNVVEQTLKSKGIQVSRDHVSEKQTRFLTQINNIKSFKSEAVVFTGYYREAALLRKQMIEQGLADTGFMGGAGIKSEEIFKIGGGNKNLEGTLCTFTSDRETMPGYESFEKEYAKISGGKEPGPYAENAHDALGAVVAAIKKANSTDGRKIVDALHKIEYSGVVGTFSFDAKGDINIANGISKFEANGGKWQPVKK